MKKHLWLLAVSLLVLVFATTTVVLVNRTVLLDHSEKKATSSFVGGSWSDTDYGPPFIFIFGAGD